MSYEAIHLALEDLEQQASEFLAPDLEERLRAEAEAAVTDYNRWASEQRAVLENRQAELEREHARLDSERQTLESLQAELRPATIDRTDAAAVARYNDRVASLEQRMKSRNQRVAAFNQSQQDLAEAIAEYNRCAAERAQEAEGAQERAQSRARVIQCWFEQEGPAELWRELRKLRAQLAGLMRQSVPPAVRARTLHERLERLRAQVESWAHARHAANPHGLVLTQAVLHGAEGPLSASCQVVVDTAASTATITREMVDILGIGEFVGEEVELNLPNAIRIKAPTVLLPAVEVQGQRAEWVKGVVLDESVPGLEGSLGMSFLSRFDYRIEGRTLLLKQRAPAQAIGMHDVFICHKSDDREISRKVYDLLNARGLRVFFSPVSIPEQGDSDFQRVIDRALEEAAHLVLICSSREAIETPWVASEWRIFINMLRSNRKRGNLVNLLCGGMSPASLPATLSRFHCVELGADGWQDELASFLSPSS